jgi:tetratricopeptide (TPR) repeat protein
MSEDDLLRSGIEAAQAGNMEEAASLLARHLAEQPDSEQGWFWMSKCRSGSQQAYCLRRVLVINPDNKEARQALKADALARRAAIAASAHPVAAEPEPEAASPVTPQPVVSADAPPTPQPVVPAAPPPTPQPVAPVDSPAAPQPAVPAAPPPTPQPVAPEDSPAAAQPVVPAAPSPTPQPVAPVDSPAAAQPVTASSPHSPRIPALLIGLAAGFILCALPILVISRIPAAASAWLATPTPTLPAPTRTASPTVTPTLDQKARFALADQSISDGLSQMWDGDYANAITAFTQVIAYLPDWDNGYALRGECYLKLLQNQRSMDEYLSYLDLARQDIDMAILLDPGNGEYYLDRYQIYEALAMSQTRRADAEAYEAVALENLTWANQLGNYDEYSDRYVGFALIALGRCDEALAQGRALEAAATEPSAGINTILAQAYGCLGDLDKALQHIDTAIQIDDNPDRRFWRASLLFAMGRLDQAKAELDDMINASPYYGGFRYYLRGLIYAVQGDLEKAQADLDFGMGQTWGQNDLLSYALGKIALAEGDETAALEYFQDAESTHLPHDPILAMIRADIQALGGTTLEITAARPATTWIPTYTPSMTPRPTSTRTRGPASTVTLFPPPQWPIIVDFAKGTGPYLFQENDSYLFHFQPAQAISFRRVQSLTFKVETTNDFNSFHLVLEIYDSTFGGFPRFDLVPGNNRIDYENRYVYPDGDIYATIINAGSNPIQIDNAGFILSVENEDGTISIYGIAP